MARTKAARAFIRLLLTVALVGQAAFAQPTRITFWHIFDSGDAQAFITEVVNTFNAENPDIVVEHLGTNFWDYWTRLTTATAAGIGPDVAMNDLGNVPSRAAAGIILPLDAYMQQDALGLDTFWEATHPIITWEGETYALPLETDVRVLYYNKDAFRDAGLDPENPPSTWEELATYSDQLTTKDARGRITRLGFTPTAGNLGYWTLAWLNGGDFVAEDGTLKIDTPENIEALQWMVDRAQAYGQREMTSFAASFGSGAADPFLTGQLAMVVQNNTFASTIEQYAPDLGFGVAPIPYSQTPASWSNGFSVEISSSTQHPEAAWRFMRHLLSDEVQLAYAQRNSSMVGNVDAAMSPELMENPTWRTFIEQMEVSRFRPFSLEAPTWYDTVLQPEVEAALLGRKSPEQALGDAQRAYEEEVRRYNQTR